MTPKIQMLKIRKDFKSSQELLKVLGDISLFVNPGEFVSIIGPSGCGKSTVFQILTGLETYDEGQIKIDNIPLEKWHKKMSYMQQKDLLMPWRTVIENVLLPLEIQGAKKKDALNRVKELLPVFGLDGFDNAYPHQLSGGMRQRAALLRTVLTDSEIMLLDEPFGALDAINRSLMQQWLLEIWERFTHSVLFVTHDIEEAIFLSDRVYVLSQRPAKVVKEITIDFPRPRKKEFLVLPEFLEYKKSVLAALEPRQEAIPFIAGKE